MYNEGWKNFQTWRVAKALITDKILANFISFAKDYDDLMKDLSAFHIFETEDNIRFGDSRIDKDEINKLIEILKNIHIMDSEGKQEIIYRARKELV